jgi:endonuclease/exonuclease/phosphatase (EEP) superfamily protein YafD
VLLEVSRRDVASLSTRLALSCVHGDYLGTATESVGGLAVCTRGFGWAMKGGVPQHYVDGDDWSYVFSEVERAGRVVNVLAVHLLPYGRALRLGSIPEVTRAQVDQSAALLERVARFEDPTVVAGDFNSTRDSALHASLRTHLSDTWETGGRGFGATVHLLDRIPLRVDYVYATDDFGVLSARVPEVDCSDHRPIVSELVLRGP